MPRKKLYCSEHVKLMRILKARLIEISLKVDNYIYKQKPITELQAKAFLDEISSYKSQCQNDIGYLQVIEKLTRYMNIIISKNTNKTPVNEVNSNNEISNNTTLSSTYENLSTTTDIRSASINRDNVQNPTKNQNTLKLSLYNESTSSAEAISKDKYESNKKCYNKVEKRSIVKKTVHLEKGETKRKTKKEKVKKTNISSKVVVNGACDESNETNISHTASMEQDSGEHKGDDTSTNNDQTLRIKKKVQSSLKNDYSLLIGVDGGVINEISHLSNTTVIHQAPEVDIPLNAFALNNTKMPNFLSKFHPKVIQNNLTIKSDEGPKHVPVIHPSVSVRKINNKKVKFTAPYIDLAENARQDKNKLDEENNKTILTSNLTASNSEKNTLSKKQRTIKKDATKNKKGNKIKESRRINDKKSHNQVNVCKSVGQSILPKEVKSSSNNLKAQNDLSWFDSIKYVRKIDEQEYFKPLQPLDDKEFNI